MGIDQKQMSSLGGPRRRHRGVPSSPAPEHVRGQMESMDILYTSGRIGRAGQRDRRGIQQMAGYQVNRHQFRPREKGSPIDRYVSRLSRRGRLHRRMVSWAVSRCSWVAQGGTEIYRAPAEYLTDGARRGACHRLDVVVRFGSQ